MKQLYAKAFGYSLLGIVLARCVLPRAGRLDRPSEGVMRGVSGPRRLRVLRGRDGLERDLGRQKSEASTRRPDHLERHELAGYSAVSAPARQASAFSTSSRWRC